MLSPFLFHASPNTPFYELCMDREHAIILRVVYIHSAVCMPSNANLPAVLDRKG